MRPQPHSITRVSRRGPSGAVRRDPHVSLLIGDVRERPFGQDVLPDLVDHLMSLPVAAG
ncbi:hypothetical protein [Streptomyces sp. NPDC002785]|uniref:hypothetical protein n=1 Tax=Streptomyces sp. NPDC002785 TaxID=3154543 RepID=UPI00331C56B0